MKILFHSGAPWAGTGYGVQTSLFTPRFRDAGHDVSISSTWGLMGDTLDWDGITVYPADDRYGNATLSALYGRVQPDLLVTLLDVWILKPDQLRGKNVAAWVPVDHDPCPPNVAKFFQVSGARPVAMSRFGQKALQDKGLADTLYVPHGVDTNVFRPAANREQVRAALKMPKDAFVVGMVANNQGFMPPRKAFPQAIQAFAAFRQDHPDALLYFHTEVTGERGQGPNKGINLLKLCETFGVPPSAVAFTPQLELELGVPSSWMAGLYNCFDVLLNPSYGEGFGVPLIEAQASGVPVIVTDWTAMPELRGSGWLVGGEPWWDNAQESYYMAPFVGDIIEALRQAYDQRGSDEFRTQAVQFAQRYDADRVMAEHWLPVLEELGRPREVPPLRRPAGRDEKWNPLQEDRDLLHRERAAASRRRKSGK